MLLKKEEVYASRKQRPRLWKSSPSVSYIYGDDVGFNFSLCSYPSRNLPPNCDYVSVVYV